MKRALLLMLLVFSACEEEREHSAPGTPVQSPGVPAFAPPRDFKKLRYGMVPSLDPETLRTTNTPLANYLSRTLNVPVEIMVESSYQATLEHIAAGDYDFFSMSPVVYLEASKRTKLNCLVQSISDGSSTASGYIFVRDDSPLKSIYDVPGTRVAFVDKDSSTGYLLPMKAFKDRGLNVLRDATVKFYGNHEAVMMAVLEGEADVGATYQGSFASLRLSRGVDPLSFRVIAKTQRTPRDIYCVRASLSAEIAREIQLAMLALSVRDRSGREILRPIDVNGFTIANDREYDGVRKLLEEMKE